VQEVVVGDTHLRKMQHNLEGLMSEIFKKEEQMQKEVE